MNDCDDCGRALCRDCDTHYCIEQCPCGRSHTCDCACAEYDERPHLRRLTQNPMTKRLPPGTPVAVHPGDGHLPEAHWLAVVLHHHDNGVGGLLGLTDVRCTDPRSFLNQRPDHVTTVETKKLRRIESEQPMLFPAADGGEQQ